MKLTRYQTDFKTKGGLQAFSFDSFGRGMVT